MKARLRTGFWLGAAAAAAVLLADAAGFWTGPENFTWGARVRAWARPGSATPRIRLLVIDEGSIAWVKERTGLSWPWPRDVWVPVLDFLAKGGASSVAFDILFLEEAEVAAQDEALGEAIARAPGFAAALYLGDHGNLRAWPGPGGLSLASPSPRLPSGLAAATARMPVAPVARSAATLGCVIDEPDPDGTVRRVRPLRCFDGRAVPLLGLASAWRGREVSLPEGRGEIRAGTDRVPVDASGRAVLRFRGSRGSYERIPVARVIEAAFGGAGAAAPLPAEAFRDCHVLVGATAVALGDLRTTPVSGKMPGVEIHATALDNLLSGDFLRDPPPPAAVGWILLLAFSGAAAGLGCRNWRHAAAAIVCLSLLPAAVGFALIPAGFWWPVAAPTAAAVLALTGGLLRVYATEGRQRRFLRAAFAQYLSPTVIDRIVADPARLELGGERRTLTIFFSDLAGFTTLSEKLDAHALAGLLNDYLTDMTDLLLDEGATVDKYVGDAIVAFWNAPLEQPDHAERAVRAALLCQRRLDARRAEFLARCGTELRMRIGLHTGEVAVGNFGSRRRFAYTMLGDAANLASRLEGANKAFGTYTMVSEATWARLEGRGVGRPIGALRVVGRNEPVRVWEPFGFSGDEGLPDAAAYLAAHGLCTSGRFAEAADAFARISGDPLSALYAGKCRELAAAGVTAWDGIWRLEQK